MTDYDPIDPTVRKQIREVQDAEYEASTRFPQPHFRTNLAQRHRFGRVLDMPPPDIDPDTARFVQGLAIASGVTMFVVLIVALVL
jgi:hypothetical protein